MPQDGSARNDRDIRIAHELHAYESHGRGPYPYRYYCPMRISVLTPSYNQARWLPENLDSVANQTYQDYEHIVMDGGSTDGSVDLLAGRDDPRLRWRSQVDDGQSDALNRAFADSDGEIIAWLNSDDTFADRRTLEWIAGAFADDPSVGVVYGHVLDTTDDSRAVRVTRSPSVWVRHMDKDINPIKQPSAFFRRAVIDNGNFVRDELHYTMDHELFLRLMDQGHRFRRLGRVLATNRHQLARKSIARNPQYEEEYSVYNGGALRRRAKRSAASWLVSSTCRVLGTAAFLRLPAEIDPATALWFPNQAGRARLQLFTRVEPYLHRLAGSGK